MVLKYLSPNVDLAETGAASQQASSSRAQRTPTKAQRRQRICFLLLSNMIVFNAVYGIWTADEDKPIWEAALTDNVICKLWSKYPLVSKSPRRGMIIGILFNEEEPLAMINNKLVREGDAVGDVKVVQIGPKEIRFEKAGKMWAQQVREYPSEFW